MSITGLLFVPAVIAFVNGMPDMSMKSIPPHEIQTNLTCNPMYYHFPECPDFPNGYGCVCGPGYLWNGYTCIGGQIEVRLHGRAEESARSIQPGDWTHVAWTLSSSGDAVIYLNATESKIFSLGAVEPVLGGGGNLILGQAAQGREKKEKLAEKTSDDLWVFHILSEKFLHSVQHARYDVNKAFDGYLSNVNIWSKLRNRDGINKLMKDCEFRLCGDIVEWTDFRSGTRAETRFLWPTNVPGVEADGCQSDPWKALTCHEWCQADKGPLCRKETIANIDWPELKANATTKVKCPSRRQEDDPNSPLKEATRSCLSTQDAPGIGIWQEPNVSACISRNQLALRTDIQNSELDIKRGRYVDTRFFVLNLLDRLLNLTRETKYYNPIDLASDINSTAGIISEQDEAREIMAAGMPGRTNQASAMDTLAGLYPDYPDTIRFSETVGEIFNNLLDQRNEDAWARTKPPGADSDKLLNVFEHFCDVIFRSLLHHVESHHVSHNRAFIAVKYENIEFKIAVHRAKEFRGMAFPDKSDVASKGISPNLGSILMRHEVLLSTNLTQTHVGISSARFGRIAKHLPNHNTSSKFPDKDQNINSAVFYFRLHAKDDIPQLRDPVKIPAAYLNNFNVSNPTCMVLVHEKRVELDKRKKWHWLRNAGCRLASNSSSGAVCLCNASGFFAIATDMYDLHWDKGEIKPVLLTIPSYIGLCISALLHLLAFVMLTYYKTRANTAQIHKQFSLAVFLAEVIFMAGINRDEYPAVCHVFSVFIHYFVTASFSWLMNEAFNLYIVITYAAHSHGEHQETGGIKRYYLLGWVFPIAVVGAIWGAHLNDYYSADMCWINWQYVWQFCGPLIGIVAVSLLVLTFTAKEHKESSYTKNEKTNKAILNHTKAIWTQLILLVVDWTFAFLSIRMAGPIIKVVYSLVNILQGAFFFVFYVLLNEEVRAMLKHRQRNRRRQQQGRGGGRRRSRRTSSSNQNRQRSSQPTAISGGGGSSAESLHSSDDEDELISGSEDRSNPSPIAQRSLARRINTPALRRSEQARNGVSTAPTTGDKNTDPQQTKSKSVKVVTIPSSSGKIKSKLVPSLRKRGGDKTGNNDGIAAADTEMIVSSV